MADFLLLYRSSPDLTRAGMSTPEARQQSMQRWFAWFRELDAQGHMKDMGQPLEPGGKVARSGLVTDGPFAEAKDLVGGFSIVTATDLAEAAGLAKGCPILSEPGGAVEVRPIQKMDM